MDRLSTSSKLVLTFMFLLAGWGASAGGADKETGEKPESFTFIQLCDPQGNWPNFERAVKQINTLKPKPDFVLVCGDLIKKAGSKEEFETFKRINAGFQMPSYCVAGNHDIGIGASPEKLERYRKLIGKDYYSFEHKNHTFIAVNTQLWIAEDQKEECEKHDAWFRQALRGAAKKQTPIIVFGHYPLFTREIDEEKHYYNVPPGKRVEVLALFQEFHVVAYLSGHTHGNLINKHKGTLLVTTTATSFGGKPLGFRLWTVRQSRYEHRLIPLAMPKPEPVSPGLSPTVFAACLALCEALSSKSQETLPPIESA